MKLFHLLNRGVDKRKIFIDDRDRYRFIHDLFEFNDKNPAPNLTYFFSTNPNNKDIGRPKINRAPRKLLVDLLAFCMMDNHYHLLVRPKAKNGVALFMKKLNGGYAKYFNERYERNGALFQGKYRAIEITDESHFIHIPYYIHCNPLDIVAPEWRHSSVRSPKKAMDYLNSYRWSSHLDYSGKHNFPSVTQREFLGSFFGDPATYKKFLREWVSHSHIFDNASLE